MFFYNFGIGTAKLLSIIPKSDYFTDEVFIKACHKVNIDIKVLFQSGRLPRVFNPIHPALTSNVTINIDVFINIHIEQNMSKEQQYIFKELAAIFNECNKMIKCTYIYKEDPFYCTVCRSISMPNLLADPNNSESEFDDICDCIDGPYGRSLLQYESIA